MSSETSENDFLKLICEYGVKAVQRQLKEDINFFKREPEASFNVLAAAIIGQGPEESLKIVELLVKHGADVKRLNDEGDSLLRVACRDNKEAVAFFLIQKGTSIHAQGIEGISPLMWAAAYNSTSLVKHLVHLGANIDAQDVDGASPLMWAACRGRLDIVKTLVEAGANITVKRGDGVTVVELATEKGETECADSA